MSEALRHVHFVAIGGTGMGSLAGLLHARGLRVTGSDEKLYPPMSTLLEQWGIPVMQGFRAENVLEHPPDLVVIGNAVRANNPEARAAIDEGLAYRSFPDALYELAIAGKHSVVISGTHGKTTTTSLVAALLHGTGRDPSLLVGGHSRRFRRELPRRAGGALRGRGRRVRHRLLRQDAEVPALRRAHAGDHLGRVRPRRHLSRSRAREAVVPVRSSRACRRTARWSRPSTTRACAT